MSTVRDVSATHIPVPDPNIGPDDLVVRAAAMRDVLRDEADAAEERGGYSVEMHQAFTAAGFYRILQPRRFGGYEFGLDTLFRVVVEIARGDPGTGWGLCLAAGHAMQVGAFYSERAQAELFGPDGHFVAPSRTAPTGTATPVDGGFRVSGRWDYCSGITHATHLMAVAVSPDPEAPDDQGRGVPLMVVIPRADFIVLDDWGGGATLGLQATGSNTVVVEDAFVPARLAEHFNWKDFEIGPEGTVGYRLHGNPMYLGRLLTFFNGELVATQVGAARAALDEYEQLIHTKRTSVPPPVPRTESPDFQRWLGELLGRTDAAERLLHSAGESYMDKCRRWEEHGEPFTPEDDARLRGVLLQAAKLSFDAIDLMFATAGTSAAKRGSRLQRYYRDASMFRTHIAAQYEVVAASTGRLLLGQPLTF
ncbi:MAG: hydroxylase [Pseudonocardiaceae bacterium]|nr:hydroxylase [Pseudonocardiaceae bacterium]